MGEKRHIVVKYIGGACPVQAEGTVDGIPFYFRARGNGWSLSIGVDPIGVSCGFAVLCSKHTHAGDVHPRPQGGLK